MKTSMCLLFEKVETINTLIYLLNKALKGTTPFEAWYGRNIDVKFVELAKWNWDICQSKGLSKGLAKEEINKYMILKIQEKIMKEEIKMTEKNNWHLVQIPNNQNLKANW
ncbi:hypothetical protein CR513_38395, partial [Mucuna pruriens]